MSGADSFKELLIAFNQKKYKDFTLNNELFLALPTVSWAPGVGASKRKDRFKKIISHKSDHHVKFITMNDEPHSFVWQTKAKNMKNAVRWGIIKTQSITGKVISALGQYRLVAHKRIAKGIISNSHNEKIKLLDLFQDRFEALQGLESLVNKNNDKLKYEKHIKAYINKLNKIKANLDSNFSEFSLGTSGLDQSIIDRIKRNINSDILKAESYLNSMTQQSLPFNNMARGPDSVMTFVKSQMLSGLYELQGINLDVTFSTQRDFAFTRGELNDFIEDGLKEIEDHQPDLVNAITKKHQGLYSKNEEELVSYDFSHDDLGPDRERDVLLGISFIEGWDKLEQTKDKSYVLSNASGTQKIDIVHATRWINHRSAAAFFKFLGHYIVRVFMSIFVSTRPWEEETWTDENFHLEATTLQKHTASNEPMWQKPWKLIKEIGNAIIDLFNGVKDFGAKLVIKMPDDIINLWASVQKPPSLGETLKETTDELNEIASIEKLRLENALKECQYNVEADQPNTSILATPEYSIEQEEQNDIFTSMARGLLQFGTVFSHNLYAKNPFGGLAFTGGLGLGAGAIYFPSATASILGSNYVNWFSNVAYTMGSSKLAATIAAGSTQAQVLATAVDGIFHGPSGIAANILYQIGEDPLTIGAYFSAASLLGYLLVNGVAGYQIPWLSETLREDLGSSPATGYPFIGAKIAVLLYEGLMAHKEESYQEPELSPGFKSLSQAFSSINDEKIAEMKKSIFALWLSQNAEVLPKLRPKQLFDLSRHIKAIFSKEESDSLHKLLYPETKPSIAFQFLALPLSYIPAILLCASSIPLTIYALGTNQESPYEPIRLAFESLFEKCKKDLSRLVVFAGFALYIPYTIITTFAKVFAQSATLIVGRIASLFNVKTGQSIYEAIGSIHRFFKMLGEYIYPVSEMKSVAVAHPSHTIKKIGSSYKHLISQLGEGEQKTKEPVDLSSDSSRAAALNFLSKVSSEEDSDDKAPLFPFLKPEF